MMKKDPIDKFKRQLIEPGMLTEKARQGKLTQDDLEGRTFTVSNIGAAGVGYRFSTVIINQPQSAILG